MTDPFDDDDPLRGRFKQLTTIPDHLRPPASFYWDDAVPAEGLVSPERLVLAMRAARRLVECERRAKQAADSA
jgi:hypothetical protein